MDQQIFAFLSSIINRARAELALASDVQFRIEKNNTRFKSADNACEYDGEIIIINFYWLERVLSHPDETQVRLLLYHEMRHVYQRNEYRKLVFGMGNLNETSDRIERWNHEMENYHRSDDPESILDYYRQEIEIDANAFSLVMLNKDRKDGLKVSTDDIRNFPDEIDAALRRRVEELIPIHFRK